MQGAESDQKPEDHKKYFELLSRTVEELNTFPDDGDIYAFIGATLRRITPDDTVILVSSYDRESRILTLKIVESLGSRKTDIEAILGRPLKGLAFPVPDRIVPAMLTGECTPIPGGLAELTFGLLPSKICKKIESLPLFGKAYSIGISWKGILMGAVTFILPRGVELENRDLITFLIRQVAGFLSRREVEQNLRRREQFAREIINNTMEGIVACDRHFNCRLWNPFMESLTGMPASEVLGKNIFELFHHPQQDEVSRLLHRALEGETGRLPDICYRMPQTGKTSWVSATCSPYYYNKGEIIGVIGNIHNISERKGVEDALRKANKKLNLLSSITRHDINNQLTVLRGYLFLMEKKQPDPTITRYLKEVAITAERIFSIIRFTEEYQSIGVNAPLWQNCRILVENAVKETRIGLIRIKNDIPAGVEVFADPLIAKVFYNLIDNAVRHGRKITTIRFSVRKSGADCRIICEDDGEGIPDDEKEKIFERGFGKNTGFGLFLAREILDITGITIRETGTSGKGARFEITVPEGTYRFP